MGDRLHCRNLHSRGANGQNGAASFPQTYAGISNIPLTYRVVAWRQFHNRLRKRILVMARSRRATGARILGCMPDGAASPACGLCTPSPFRAGALRVPQPAQLPRWRWREVSATRRPQPHRSPYLVVIVPACLAAEQMPPHVEAGPEWHGALQIVRHQFAHIAAGRHAYGPPRSGAIT